MLPPRHKPFAGKLLQVTGIGSLSNLFVVFLTRYGSHLRASWNSSQCHPIAIHVSNARTKTERILSNEQVHKAAVPTQNERPVEILKG